MPHGYKRLSTLDRGQRSLLQQLLSQLQGQATNIQQNPLYQQGSSYLQNLLSQSPESTQAFEAPYLRQFNERTVPALAERFAGTGSLSSSAFQNALGQAGAGLQENLASLRGGLQMQGLPQALGYAQQPTSNFLGLSGLGLGTQTQAFVPKQQSFLRSLLTSMGPGLGQAAGMLPFLL